MNFTKHGFSVGIERVDSNIFLSLIASCKLTHEDYELITPMIDSALREVKMPKINVQIDGTEMEDWEQ